VKHLPANIIASNAEQLHISSSAHGQVSSLEIECPIVNETQNTVSSAISSVATPLAPPISVFKFSYKNNGKEISFELPI
jgi:hypothetical protein